MELDVYNQILILQQKQGVHKQYGVMVCQKQVTV